MKRGLNLHECAIFRVRSFDRLSRLLFTPLAALQSLVDSNQNYMEYNSKGRWIEEPKSKLMRVQKRFAKLLAQISPPEYLHSAVKKRSYVSNAKGHTIDLLTIQADIQKFYVNARAAEVYHFYRDILEWDSDVAAFMTKLTTIKGHIPTGSPASPILSFWSYKSLFDEVHELAKQNGCNFTLYVDDITLSGRLATRALLQKTRRVVGSHRLKVHKLHSYPAGVSKIITGIAQTPGGTKLPFTRVALIDKAYEDLQLAGNEDDRRKLLKPLLGRLCEASEIDPKMWLGRRDAAIQEMKALDATLLSSSAASIDDAVENAPAEVVVTETSDVPWA